MISIVFIKNTLQTKTLYTLNEKTTSCHISHYRAVD